MEGCVFSAAPKVVALHVKLQHESGVFDKIVQSYDTGEIEKWKAERRRNYPTLENIEQKLAMKKEMDVRGERLEDKNGPFNHKKGFTMEKEGRQDSFKRKKNNRKRKRTPGDKPQFLSTASLSEDLIKSTEDEVTKEVEHFSDDEWQRDNPGGHESAPPASKVLMALSASYASDIEDELLENEENQSISALHSSENDNETPTELKISRESDNLPNIHLDRIKQIDLSKEEIPPKVIKKPIIHNKTTEQGWKPSIKRRPLTLLEKLLSNEIRKERNHVLQCIRFIIQENYFQEKKIST